MARRFARQCGSTKPNGYGRRLQWAGAGLIWFGLAVAARAAPAAADAAGPPYQQPHYGSQADAAATRHSAAEPPTDSPRQASYQSVADYGASRQPTGQETKPLPLTAKSPANLAEPMPLTLPGHDSPGDPSAAHGHHAPGTPSAVPAILSMFASLAVVLGLFLGVMWFLRRGLPKGTRVLSADVVEVLGRAPLAGRQQMHLIRFGNRLLLISVSPTGAETLAEISEPGEVDRLAGICQQSHTSSATNAFRQIFRQLADARGGKTLEPIAAVGDAASDNVTSRRSVLKKRLGEDDHA